MASTSNCPYCGGIVKSSERICPNCGAVNDLYVEDASKVILTPHTIEELQEYCAERNMPLQRMRFFIGEDYKKPKAFGIYKEADGKVIVYKNKADGSRAIRYTGYDEGIGVSEIYKKLLDECHSRNIWPDTPDGKRPKELHSTITCEQALRSAKNGYIIKLIIAFLIVPIAFIGGTFLMMFVDGLEAAFLSAITGAAIGVQMLIITQLLKWGNEEAHKDDSGAEERKEKHNIFGIVLAISTTVVFGVAGYIMGDVPFFADASVWLISFISAAATWIITGIVVLIIKKVSNKETLVHNAGRFGAIIFTIALVISIAASRYSGAHPDGYYVTDKGVYYRQGLSNYYYDSYTNDWVHTFDTVDADDYSSADYTYELDDWDIDYSSRFESTDTYSDYHDRDSSSSDSSSSFDSWDSGGTDWDSDW